MLLIATLQFVLAAFWALLGTNAQARLSRERLLADEDPLVAEAGRLWKPGPRWLRSSSHRKRRADAEEKVRRDAELERLGMSGHARVSRRLRLT